MKEQGRERQELQGAFGELWLLQPAKGPSLTKRCSPFLVPRARSRARSRARARARARAPKDST